MEWLLQVVLEGVLQGVAELLADKTLRGSPEGRKWLKGLLYGLVGMVLGGISWWLWPEHWIEAPGVRWAGLLITPVLLGVAFQGLGRWRERRCSARNGLETFWTAWAFAFGFGLVRLSLAG